MGWHCMTIWECELKHGVRERTLEALVYTLNHIYLKDNTMEYTLAERDDLQIAAEPSPDHKETAYPEHGNK